MNVQNSCTVNRWFKTSYFGSKFQWSQITDQPMRRKMLTIILDRDTKQKEYNRDETYVCSALYFST